MIALNRRRMGMNGNLFDWSGLIDGSISGDIVVPDGITSLREYCFNACREITGITLPEGLTSVGAYACANLRTAGTMSQSPFYIDLPSTVTTLGTSCLMYAPITRIVIPSGVTVIPVKCFSDCRILEEVVIQGSVTVLNQQCFQACHMLRSITLPASVTRIYAYVFASCNSLESITILATTPPTLSSANALSSSNNCPIYVPAESVEAYKAANIWSQFASRIQAIPTT
jgi:hypothetical protein